MPGSNGHVSARDVEAATVVIQTADMLLLQLEIPVETVLAAIAIAKIAGVRVIVDPAPMPPSLHNDILKGLVCEREFTILKELRSEKCELTLE